MKKTILSLTLAASVFGLAACSGADNDKAILSSESAGNITVSEFNDTSKKLVGSAVMKQMLTEKLLSEQYKVSDKEVDEAVDNLAAQVGGNLDLLLQQNGLSEEGLKYTLRVQLLQEKALNDKAIPADEVKKVYEQGKYELNGRHILVEDEKTAKEVVKKLKDGGDFATVAKEFSKDTGSAANGGDLGWFTVGQMVPEFNDAAYELELNKVSEPIQSDFGFHIIEITDKREVKDYPKFEDKEKEIRSTLGMKLQQNGEAQAILDDLLKDLAKKADFKTDDPVLSEALASFMGEEKPADAEDDAKDKDADKAEDKKDDKK